MSMTALATRARAFNFHVATDSVYTLQAMPMKLLMPARYQSLPVSHLQYRVLCLTYDHYWQLRRPVRRIHIETGRL